MMAVSCSALAQDNGQDIDDTGLGLEEIVVTGVAVGTAKLDTSVSVSSLNYSNSYKTAPRSLW